MTPEHALKYRRRQSVNGTDAGGPGNRDRPIGNSRHRVSGAKAPAASGFLTPMPGRNCKSLFDSAGPWFASVPVGPVRRTGDRRASQRLSCADAVYISPTIVTRITSWNRTLHFIIPGWT